MAEGISGLGSGAAANLNDELIEKLRAADEKAYVDPIDTRIENLEKENEAFSEIKAQIQALGTSVKNFSLSITSGGIFDYKSGQIGGEGIQLDESISLANVDPGRVSGSITTLAKRDVWQSNTFTSSDKPGAGTLTINGVDFTTTTDTTYDDLANDINNNTNFIAEVAEVADGSFRLVVKSAESGTANALTITQTDFDLGFNDVANHVQTAANLNATVDGVSYDTSSNLITLANGLTVQAVKEGSEFSVDIKQDNSQIEPAMNDFITAYNTLVDIINDKSSYDEDANEAAPLQNTSEIRSILNNVKEKIFGSYGDDDNDGVGDENLFNYGLNLDFTGKLSLDTATFNAALSDTESYDKLKKLLVGEYGESDAGFDKKGLGEQLYTYVSELEWSNGAISLFESRLSERKSDLEADKEKAIENLDIRYAHMKDQFVRYASIIEQMETAFGGMKMMIEQSTVDQG